MGAGQEMAKNFLLGATMWESIKAAARGNEETSAASTILSPVSKSLKPVGEGQILASWEE